MIPSVGVDPIQIIRGAEGMGVTRDIITRLMRICVKDYPGFRPEPLLAFKGESISDDYAKYLETEQELVERTGKPVLCITGADMLINTYGVKEALSAIRIDFTRVKEMGGLGIVLLKPGYPRLAKILSATADVHLRITREHEAVLVYGVKPRTSLHVLEMDISRGYSMPKLTPII